MHNILIVDDDTAMRRSFRALLESEGYEVRTARQAEEALQMVGERRPDLVLLDVMMPRRNGFSLCEELRANDRLLPIIFLSVLDGDMEKVRGIRSGADDYIVKTAADSEILARVRRAIDRVESFRRVGAPMLHLGKVKVDFSSMTAAVDGDIIHLTPSEAAILKLLATERGEYFSVEAITRVLAAGDDSLGSVRSHISRLKAKLGPAGDLLSNSRSKGYSLAR